MKDVGPLHPLETPRLREDFAAGPELPHSLAGILYPCLSSLRIEPVCAYAWSGRPGWRLEPRTVADSMWFYFSAGLGQAAVGDLSADTFDFGPGSLILVPAGRRHWIRLSPGSGMRMHSVHFHARVLDGFEAIKELGFPGHWHMPDPSTVEHLCENMAREHALGLPGAARCMEANITALLISLVRLNPASLQPRFQGFHRSGFGRLREFMHWTEHMLTDPQASIENAAQTIGVSESYLRRVLRSHLGMGPRRFLLNRRLERSLVLLRTTTRSVEAVAAACGFADAPYFHRAFSSRYRMTPSAYRRSLHFPPGAENIRTCENGGNT